MLWRYAKAEQPRRSLKVENESRFYSDVGKADYLKGQNLSEVDQFIANFFCLLHRIF